MFLRPLFLNKFLMTGYRSLVIDGSNCNEDLYWGDVVLMMHFDDANGDFIDETGKVVSVFGNVVISDTQKMFTGKAGYFDGTGDYLTILASTDFAFGTGDFTVEFWVYPTTLTSIQTVIDARGSLSSIPWLLNISPTGLVYYNGDAHYSSNISIQNNNWYHISLVRSSGLMYGFINGNECLAINETAYLTNTILMIGNGYDGNYGFNGYLDELRITKGVARYSVNPTKLLCHFDYNTGFTEETGKVASFVGGVSPLINSSKSKIGTSSSYFNHSGNGAISFPSSNDWNFGNNDFTVEFWIYPTDVIGSAQDVQIIGCHQAGVNFNWVAAFVNGAISFKCGDGGPSQWPTNYAMINVVPLNEWTHIAFVRNNNVLTSYKNGTIADTSSLTVNIANFAYPLCIGGPANEWTNAHLVNAYIDEVRISNSVRYSSNFTPSLTPFSVDTNTKLLCHFEGTEGPFLKEETGKEIKVLGNASIVSQSKFGGYSAYFDGTGDYLTVPASQDFVFGTGDFTIEFWVYLPTSTTSRGLVSNRNGSTNAHWSIEFYDVANSIDFHSGVVIIAKANSSIPINTWTFVAVQRKSSVLSIFYDGVEKVSASCTQNFSENNPVNIGYDLHVSQFYGYIDELRITKGKALYSASGDVLLMHMDQSYIPAEELSKNVLDTIGSTITPAMPSNLKCSNAQSKIGYTSLQFVGTGAIKTGIFIDSLENNGLGTGPFTFEAWIYPTNLNDANVLLSNITGSTGYLGQAFSIISNGSLMIHNPYGVQWTGTTGQITVNTWTHVALTVQNLLCKFYINGSLVGTHDATSSGYSWNGVATSIGDSRLDHVAWYHRFTGYMDAINLTRSIKYTDNFTPSLDVPVTDANTVVMLECAGTPDVYAFKDETAKNITITGNVVLSSTQSKVGGYSGYFNGSSYLSAAYKSIGTKDFTIEAWAWGETPVVGFPCVVSINDFWLCYSGESIGNVPYFGGYTFTVYESGGLPLSLNSWHHLAAVRKDGDFYLLIDGILKATNTSYRTMVINFSNITIGFAPGSPGNTIFKGYIDEVHIMEGVALYTENFTPQTTEHTYVPYLTKDDEGNYLPPIVPFNYDGHIISDSNSLPPLTKFPSCRTLAL